jgi:hypothetical protein
MLGRKHQQEVVEAEAEEGKQQHRRRPNRSLRPPEYRRKTGTA